MVVMAIAWCDEGRSLKLCLLQAIGVQTTGDKGALAVTTKTPRKWNKPAENTNTATYSTTKSNRKYADPILRIPVASKT